MTPDTLRDIKGPLSLRGHINFVLLIIIVVVLAVTALVLLYLIKRRKARPPKPPVPAHQLAYEQLEVLKRKELIQKGMFKEYYTEISDIIRHYLENRFLLKAPEMTTEEFLFYVRESGSLVSAHKELLKDFLVACDMVKFARHTPSMQDSESMFDSAKKLVDETREHEMQM